MMSVLDKPFFPCKIDDFPEALDLCMFLPDQIALPAHHHIADSLFLGLYLGFKVVNLVVEFEDEPAKVVRMLAVDFFGFFLDDLLDSCDEVLSVVFDGFHALVLLFELLILSDELLILRSEPEGILIHFFLS